MENNNKILLITTISESCNNLNINHYSNIKGKLLGNGLKKNNYIPYYLTNEDYEIYSNNDEYYVNHSICTPIFLTQFKYIIFCLHNVEILKQFYELTNIFQNIIDAKKLNSNLIVINKTCLYPISLDLNFNIDSLNFFDKIFLQTNKVNIPKFIIKKLLNINKEISIENLHKINLKFIEKINYSEMTFNNDFENYKNNYDLNLDHNKINLVYIGRLSWCNGMDMNYIIKIMKKLGLNYKLYIIPGSFKLPNDPSNKKYGCSRINYLNKYHEFFKNYKIDYLEENMLPFLNKENFINEIDDNNICNIEILPQFNYGEHFHILKQFDIGISFSQNKLKKEEVGSTKLFDYMCSNIKIVSENGFQNCKYIEDYNFGKLISLNSTVSEYVNAIKEVQLLDKSNILYDKFIKDHNYISRAKQFLYKI